MNVFRNVVQVERVWGTLPDALRSVDPKKVVFWLKTGRFVTPRVELIFEETPGCSLPFRFSGQPIELVRLVTKPVAIFRSVKPADAYHWLVRVIEL